MGTLGSFGKIIGDELDDLLAKGLRSNKSVNGNALGDALKNVAGKNPRPWAERGLHGVYNQMKGKDAKLGDAIKHAYTNADDKLALGTIAGSYIGASAAYRVASGGGLYKDRNGNSNLIGIPFI